MGFLAPFDVFGTSWLSLGRIILRSSCVYLALLGALRLVGKRHVAQLSLLDFVLVLLPCAGETLSQAGPASSVCAVAVQEMEPAPPLSTRSERTGLETPSTAAVNVKPVWERAMELGAGWIRRTRAFCRSAM